jgi:hypothetical protein
MYVLPEFGPAIEAALVKTKLQRLSRAGLETLAIIVYKQPCSTPEIERIRGVSCGGVLSTLLERDLVAISGRSEGPGRPLLYGTTRKFLEYFGLNTLDDLPRVEELEKILAERSPLGSASEVTSDDLGTPDDQNADQFQETTGEPPIRLIIKHGAEPDELSLFPEDSAVGELATDASTVPENGDGQGEEGEVSVEESVDGLDAAE